MGASIMQISDNTFDADITVRKGQHFRTKTGHPYNLRRALKNFERGYIQNILVLNRWNEASAAEMLGISRKTLVAKMKKYDLSEP